jgi:hypothetical protein
MGVTNSQSDERSVSGDVREGPVPPPKRAA